jgi:hypothetical protein
MGLWSRVFQWWKGDATEGDQPVPDEPPAADVPDKTVELPTEPYVFECQSCGKVFEARRRRPLCPECDSDDVTVVSE